MGGWRWWVGRLGRVLIALGLLVLLFAVYQLWGTGIEAARAQSDLKSEFRRALSATTVPTPTTTISTALAPPSTVAPTPTTLGVAPTIPPEGGPLAKIEIPRIGVNWIMVEGVATADLRKGPGHYPGTPVPGQVGNVAIAGHRTTYGAPFNRVNELQPGDEIDLTTVTGRYVYRVTGQRVVSPSETSVLANTPGPTITLTSCTPEYSASQRIIISGALDAAHSSPLLAPPGAAPPPTTPPAKESGGAASSPVSNPAEPDPAVVVPTTIASGGTFGSGWVNDPDAWNNLALWGIVLTVIGIGAWLLGRRIPQWAAALIGLLPFLVALYFFFDNVNRLLPSNL